MYTILSSLSDYITEDYKYFQPDYPVRILKEYNNLIEKTLEFYLKIIKTEDFKICKSFLPIGLITTRKSSLGLVNISSENHSYNETRFKYYFKQLNKKTISYNYNALLLKDLPSKIYKKLLVFPYCMCSMDSIGDVEHELTYTELPELKTYTFECISPFKDLTHRIILARQLATTRFGFEIPVEIERKYPEAIGLVGEYHLLYEKMLEKKVGWVNAQYCTLMGHRTRYLRTFGTVNKYIETEIEKDIYRAILNKDPNLKDFIEKPSYNIIQTNRLITLPKSFKEK